MKRPFAATPAPRILTPTRRGLRRHRPPVLPCCLEVVIRFRLLIAAAFAALTFTPLSSGASTRQLHAREHRQVRSLHRRVGTVRFFRSHLRLARTAAGRRALRVAHVWLPIIRRELAETRAQLRPRYAVPAWWLAGALCVHRGESGNWAIENPPYSGGMQMDATFQATYGPEFVRRWGSAGHWPPSVQLLVAYRGWLRQGWGAWPNTSRACGLR